jgi:hypothetical protein
MTFFLRIVDHTGRGYKSLLPFDTEAEREAHVVASVKSDGANEEDIAEIIAWLDRGDDANFAHTEYEYLNN